MTDAPERIWADGDETGLDCFCDWSWVRGSWNRSKEGVGEVEYIRADLVEALEAERARAEKAEAERDQAIKALSKAAEARGRAEGKLAASELPGIIDGWKARAEKAEAALDKLLAEARLEGWRAGRDAAAKVVDEFEEHWLHLAKDYHADERFEDAEYYDTKGSAAEYIALTIRALPEPKEAPQ